MGIDQPPPSGWGVTDPPPRGGGGPPPPGGGGVAPPPPGGGVRPPPTRGGGPIDSYLRIRRVRIRFHPPRGSLRINRVSNRSLLQILLFQLVPSQNFVQKSRILPFWRSSGTDFGHFWGKVTAFSTGGGHVDEELIPGSS